MCPDPSIPPKCEVGSKCASVMKSFRGKSRGKKVKLIPVKKPKQKSSTKVVGGGQNPRNLGAGAMGGFYGEAK